MNTEEALKVLKNYREELEGILSRFHKTRDGIHIDRADDPRFREIAIELKDLASDELVDNKNTSFHLIRYFDESISTFTGTPSYKGVENIKGVVSTLITRIERNPLILKGNVVPNNESSRYNVEHRIGMFRPALMH